MVFSKRYVKLISDTKSRYIFKTNEIFNLMCKASIQVKFSNNMYCFFIQRAQKPYYKTLFKNRCLLTFTTNSVKPKFKMGNAILKKNILHGNVVGFYRALW